MGQRAEMLQVAPAVPGEKGVIVVIDDHDSTLHFMKEALTLMGYTPLLAEDGKKGLELCRTHDVSLVLTDYLMPNMSGLEVAEKIKSLPRPLPVILTSASYLQRDNELSKKGVDYFLNKPFRLEELESVLQEALHSGGKKAACTVDRLHQENTQVLPSLKSRK